MRKKVVYTGNGTDENALIAGKTVVVTNGLKKGNIYKVVKETVYNWHTELELEGIDGTFNSVLFDEQKAYIATAKEKPIKGKPYECKRLQKGKFQPVRTSEVQSVEELGGGIYAVETASRYYYVSVEK